MAKIIYLDSYRKFTHKNCTTCNLPPKGTEWIIKHRHWCKNGCEVYEAFVFDYEKGLTAYEAYEKAALPLCPAFYEVTCEQLNPFPYPFTKAEAAE